MTAQYEARLAARRQAAENHERQFRQLGNYRLITAIAAAILAFYNFWLLPVPIVVFVVLLVIHDRVERKAHAERRGIAFYERALLRLNDKWMGSGETGERFRNPMHPYADDLDLFGPASLFQLLCAARTAEGESVLARWLMQPSTRDEVRLRQGAVDELKPRLDLREDLALLGEDVRSGLHAETLGNWGARTEGTVPSSLRWGARLLAVGSVATGVSGFFGFTPWWPFLLFVLADLMYTYNVRQRVEHILEGAELPARDLGLLAEMLARVEREPFQSDRMVQLRAELETEGLRPSQQISRLRKLIEMHDWAHNQGFAPIAFLLIWKPQIAWAVEDWRTGPGEKIGRWIQAVGEMEALSSMAAYAAEHPDDRFPQFTSEAPVFDAQGLGHPLIPSRSMVRNDLRLDRAQQLLLVSGSNMSGKSTLLRAAGLASVMAWAGLPVRAYSLMLSDLQVGASMRVNDSVTDGKSRFYAEIMRLRQIVDLSAASVPLLFLLDELLSGTNSHDRRIGAEAIVRSLVTRGAIGLVTTHDLALAAIVQELGSGARNVHFEDHIEDGRIAFDYKMRDGVVTKSNALELMRSIGLDV